MNIVLTFLVIVSWIALLFGILRIVVTIQADMAYAKNKLAQSLDRLNGITRTFPLRNTLIYTVASGAFLIAYYVNR